jgi:hypothetical protein
MRYAAVMLSELGTACISALKALEQCHKCNSVAICKLPEAKPGRIKLAEIRVEKAKEILKKARKNLRNERI